MNSKTLQSDLSQFIGTDNWHQHALNRKMTYTDGVQYFAENAGAYWFLDIVATELMEIHRREAFLNIKLIVEERKATILADDGNDRPRFSRNIEYTDCPPGEWQFYLTDNVMLLPSEY